MFIKRGADNDGKILEVISQDQLTEEQKKSTKIALKDQDNKSEDNIVKKDI